MNTFFVRFSVLALAITGFGASSVISHSQEKSPVLTPVHYGVTMGSIPRASCLPGNGCTGGIGDPGNPGS